MRRNQKAHHLIGQSRCYSGYWRIGAYIINKQRHWVV